MTTTLTARRTDGDELLSSRREWHGAGVGTQVLVLTGRSLRAVLADPRIVIFSLLQPLIMLTLFSQVFGKALMGSISTAGGGYINYLMPAILVTSGIGAALQSGVGLITDMKNGVLARFRSLPIRMGAVLLGRSLADLVRTAVQLVVLLLAAVVLFGFSPAAGLVGTFGALLLALLVSWSLTWVFLAIASWVRKEEVMQSIGFLAMFPLMFASSAFVPLDALPTWLRVVATINPLTYAVDASRDLSLALPTGTGVISALATSALLLVIGAVFAIRGFRRPL
ncbi:ABC-2 type transport system permease protein [Saccharopolyspora lacisalsi]|uniref:Transport permease protein n=1 Tax=Halosaccharopolyspora lacisalsi TaxID=1000566 RepID=A0A839DTW9_9PSEU|nr:ABC transporter permease [Halosaccharopolyspora lacisalsi]MBA8823726.1 ABC-2 type transport system permease protein [Halosaccharopolyspora lacisalsi]